MAVGLQGKVAVVTGAGSGIGAAVAARLSRDGCAVAVLDRDAAGAEAVATELGALVVEVDVADSAAVDRAFDEVEAQLGEVDVLVNNAGIGGVENAARVRPRLEQRIDEVGRTGRPPGTRLDATRNLPDEEWAQMIAVNLTGVFYGTRRALQTMEARGDGAIVNIASICGMQGCAGFPHYSAAKAGVLGFTRAVGVEVAASGVRVNAVAPGFIDTPLQVQMGSKLMDSVLLQIPQGRLGQPEDVAAVVAFLAGPDSGFMVAQTVSPNGGHVPT